MTDEIARLVELSERATPGSWKSENPHKIMPRSTVCYLYFGEKLPNHEGYSDCLSIASERGLADAEFLAALVNWFRENKYRIAVCEDIFEGADERAHQEELKGGK